jgi:NLI interacting factor-like phosphatase
MKLLICDLDETLIHTSETELAYKADFYFDNYFVYYRPWLFEFLNLISIDFKIGIWSSASDDYVQEITKQIFPAELKPIFVYGRSKCVIRRDLENDKYIYEKRIEKLKTLGFSKEEILIIDDSKEKLRTNYGNAIYVNEFLGNKDDNELEKVYKYIQIIKNEKNYREIEKRFWRSRINT